MSSPSTPNPRRSEELFLEALDIPSQQREQWLQARCEGDDALRDEVLELLDLHEQNADGVLDLDPPEAVVEQAPIRIGRYRIVRLLGTGGMSSVYEAVHQTTSTHTALKVIRVGLATARQRARFQIEAELLARLNHPHIAHFKDAGQSEAEYADGSHTPRSYIAMEYVDGVPIHKFAADRNLTRHQRVRLISMVARAVQHAHERGIIHRDLKPANILVSPAPDGSLGTPKVVDFGIAKLVRADRAVTVSGLIMGTPNYMSPEQLSGKHRLVGPASDVYGLGAVLYELLAGRPPIESPSGLSPSAVFAMLQAEPTRVINLKSDVPRDLDAVVHRALERSIDRRYSSAREFADDLDRWLNNRPVEARPPTITDRFRLQLRRRPRLTVGILVGGVALLSLGSVAAWQAWRAVRAERVAREQLAQALFEKTRADEQARIAEAVQTFLSRDILAAAGSERQIELGLKPNPDLKLTEVLDRAVRELDAGRLTSQPAVEAAIRTTIASAFLSLGLPDRALPHAQRGSNLFDANPQSDTSSRVIARATLGTCLSRSGKFAEAVNVLRAALDLARQHLGPDDRQTLITTQKLAMALSRTGETKESLPLAIDAAARMKRVLGPTDPDTLTAIITVGDLAPEPKRVKDLAELQATYEAARTTLGDENPATLTLLNSIARTHMALAQWAEAEKIYVPLCEISARVLGPDHDLTLSRQNNLALAYSSQGRLPEAIAIFESVLKARRARGTGDDAALLNTLQNLGAARMRSGDLPGAAADIESAAEIRARVLGADHRDTLMGLSNLAEVYRRAKQLDRAETLADDVINRMDATIGPDHEFTILARGLTAQILIDRGQFQPAEAIYREQWDRAKAAFGPESRLAKKLQTDLAKCLTAQGRKEEADALRNAPIAPAKP